MITGITQSRGEWVCFSTEQGSLSLMKYKNMWPLGNQFLCQHNRPYRVNVEIKWD